MSINWHFPVLIVTVSLVYSATRFEQWNLILQEALYWGLRMTGFLAMIGIGLMMVSALDWWLSLTIGGIVTLVMTFFSMRVPKPTPPGPPVAR